MIGMAIEQIIWIVSTILAIDLKSVLTVTSFRNDNLRKLSAPDLEDVCWGVWISVPIRVLDSL